MNGVSAKLKRFPKLERLLVDTDVNPYLIGYLRAVGFNVKFVLDVRVDIHNDAAIIRYGREHGRIVVCHDRYKDRETKIKVFREIYDHGGQAIQVSRGSDQHPLTSLGKILVHRYAWLEFFKDNDGIVLVHESGMKRMPRPYLIKQVQGILGDKESVIGEIPLKSPRRPKIRRRPKPVAKEQLQMQNGNSARE